MVIMKPQIEVVLAEILTRDRDAILDLWTEALLSSPHDHYRPRPPAELRSWIESSLDALIDALATGSAAPLEQRGKLLGKARQQLGFQIDEVLDGLLRGCDAMLPSMLAALGSDPRRLVAAIAAAEKAMRRLTSAFGRVFADAMRDQRQRMAALEERQRLARDLHDSVTQSLYAATNYTAAVTRLLDAGEIARARTHLDNLGESARQALRELRLLVYELRPSILPREGLEAALTARLDAVERRAGIAATLACDGIEGLPIEVQEGLYGAASEALNNAIKHAAASRIDVTIKAEQGSLVLEVVDDGSGFDHANRGAHGGLGLLGMEERARALGGCLEIESSQGRGTTVKIVLDLDPAAGRTEADRPGGDDDG